MQSNKDAESLRPTTITTVRDSGSYLFHGSNRTSYAGRGILSSGGSIGKHTTGKSTAHILSRESKISMKAVGSNPASA